MGYAKAVIYASLLICTLFPGFALSDYTTLSGDGGQSFIVVDAPDLSEIYLNHDKIGTVERHKKGAIVENVAPGLYILKVVTPGFEPQSWPISVGDGEVQRVVARSSSPAQDSSETERRLESSNIYAQSRLSTIELNRIREEMNRENKKEIVGAWFINWRNRRRDKSNFDQPQRTNNPNALSVTLLGEDGRRHILRVSRKSEYVAYAERAGSGLFSHEHHYTYRGRVKYTFFMNDKEFHLFECKISGSKRSYSEATRDLERSISSEQIRFSNFLYPVNISVERTTRKLRPNTDRLRDGSHCQFLVKTNPRREYTQ